MVRITALSLALISSAITAISAGTAGQIAAIVDADNWCMFMPPAGSTDMLISDNEWDGITYCEGNVPEATGAGKLPSGFILSAHYAEVKNGNTVEYVQITGQIDPSKGGLVPTDEGGQFDVRSPEGATCAGWQYFVNIIEPAGSDFCIRCCNDDVNCNRGISQDGCFHVIPGDYSGPVPGLPVTTPKYVNPATVTKKTTTKAAATSAAAAATTKVAGSSSSAPAAAPVTGSTSSTDSTTGSTTGSSPAVPAAPVAGSSSIAALPALESTVSSPASSVLSTSSSVALPVPSSAVPSDNVEAQSVSGASSLVPVSAAALAGVAALLSLAL